MDRAGHEGYRYRQGKEAQAVRHRHRRATQPTAPCRPSARGRPDVRDPGNVGVLPQGFGGTAMRLFATDRFTTLGSTGHTGGRDYCETGYGQNTRMIKKRVEKQLRYPLSPPQYDDR